MNLSRIASVLFLCTGLAVGQNIQSAPALMSAADAPTGAAPIEPKAPRSFDLGAIDKSADPCADFYQYACGNWRKANPIPADQTRWGRFNELAERNRYLLYSELKQASTAPSTPLQKKYGDFFSSCMNTDQAEKLGDQPIQPLLKQVAGLSDKKQLASLLAQFESQDGMGAFFRFDVEQDQKDSTKQIAAIAQGGLSLPDRDYYLNDDERTTKIRTQYHDYVVGMFKLLGDSDTDAAAEAANVLKIETALAKGSLPRVDLRDPDKRYHPMAVTALSAIAPAFDWSTYFSDVKLPALDSLNVGQPDFFKTVNTVVDSESLDTIKSYLRFRVANISAPWLSTAFADASFNFFQKTLNGQAEQQPRWKRCTALTDRVLGEAVGQDWVKQNFPPDAKANMQKLVAALDKALAADIQSLPWMTDDTKKQAEAKLTAFRNKIGYPDKWRDYSSLKIEPTDLTGNLQRYSAFDFDYDRNKIGKPVDEKEWGMTPPTVNAYYNPSMNDINFPAGILQPPFFDNSKDPAVNFGAIGVVIGHEMTHGFDDQGSKYDGQGNVKQWWTPADRKAFDERTDCEVKEYGDFEPVSGQKLNGKLTLGENTADNGGIHIAFQALTETLAQQGAKAEEKIDGYTPAQRFFISFAQVWCENRTDQSARVLARTDPHSPGMFRTNGTVQNFDEFGKAFGCHAGQAMMPQNACRVW
jgi:putative endopeptidase